MSQYGLSENKPHDDLRCWVVGAVLCATVAAATTFGYPANLDFSPILRSEHNVVRVEVRSGTGLALTSAGAAGAVHGG